MNWQQTADSSRDIVAEDVAGVYWTLEPRIDLPKGGSRRGSILGASQLPGFIVVKKKLSKQLNLKDTGSV